MCAGLILPPAQWVSFRQGNLTWQITSLMGRSSILISGLEGKWIAMLTLFAFEYDYKANSV